MAFDVDALKKAIDLVSCIGSYVALKKQGKEYKGCCPFHADKTPSFYVVPAKNMWHCFGCEASGDVIDFVQQIEGLTFTQACERLGAQQQWTPKPITQSAPPLPDRITSKPPPDAGRPDMKIRALGEPSTVWEYRDTDGGILGYVCRYETPDGKQVRCWTFGKRGNSDPGWACGHWTQPRPIYGLEHVAANPAAPVLVVEGEKAATAAQRLLPQYAVVTWPGGAQAWHKAGWSPLAGRKVLLWPDADEAGRICMEKLAAVLSDPRGLACSVRIIDPTSQPVGWDLADAEAEGWDTAKVIEWAKPRASDYVATQQPNPESQGGVGASEIPPPVTAAAPPADSGPPDDALPPVDAYAAEQPTAPRQKRPRKPRLAVVGNAALAPDPDAEPMPAALSDDAIADHLVDAHGAGWRYVKPWGAWFRWDGDGWRRDEAGGIDRLCLEVTRQAVYWPEAATLSPDGKRKINSRRTAGAVRDNASNDPRCAAAMDQWDSDPWLLGCPGGVLELRAGKMLEAERTQYITKRCAVAPAAGKPERWLEFLTRITAGDDSLIGYLQRFAGYSLTGETSEHSLVFLYGTGANGKTVFLQTISGILGDYAVSAGIETFTETKNERHSTEIARLRGARLVVTEETDAGGRWAEGKIKRLTGGGKISAHFMRQDDFEFTPQFKLMIAGNHKPMLRSVDEAIRRRFHLVPFGVTIPIEERDKHLMEKLREEWPQILGWMLDGCVAWQECSLGLPEAIQRATDQYLEAEDTFGQWIDDCCDREGRMESARGYQNYSEWCDKQGERALSRRRWANALVDRGYGTGSTGRARTIEGLSVKLLQSVPDPG